jgi:hypothetical protein
MVRLRLLRMLLPSFLKHGSSRMFTLSSKSPYFPPSIDYRMILRSILQHCLSIGF